MQNGKPSLCQQLFEAKHMFYCVEFESAYTLPDSPYTKSSAYR